MSGGFYGADVAELRQLAQRFSAAADDLDRAARMLTQQVMTTTQWRGADAEGFRGQWGASHRVNVVAVAGALRTAAGALTRNADEQDRASSAGGGGGRLGGFPLPGTPHPAAPPWGSERPGGFDLLGLAGPAVQDAWHQVIHGKLPGTSWTWGDVAGMVPVVGDAITIVDGADKALHGQLPWHEAVDLVASKLRTRPNPISYGIGFVASTWADVVELGTRSVADGGIDWSAKGMSDLWQGMHNPDAWKEAGKAVADQFPRLVAGNALWW